MNLDVGAGSTDRGVGWLRLDIDIAHRPDVVARARALPFRDGCVDELVAADVLEHLLPWNVTAALAEWARVVAAGGELRVRVPNLRVLGRYLQHACGDVLADAIRNVYGGHRWGVDGAHDCHHHGWTPDTLHETLTDAGFDVVDNDYAVNMTATARRRVTP